MSTSSRYTFLRYTKSVHKLCIENGKEDDLSDGETPQPQVQSQQPAYHAKTFSHKTTSSRLPLESIFANPPSSAPTSPAAASVSAPSLTRANRSASEALPHPSHLTNNPTSPSPRSINPASPSHSTSPSSPSSVSSPSGSPGKKAAPRRPLIRESASLHLPVRQIEQEGAPPNGPGGFNPATIGRKDTITLYDWYAAMDAEAEKERAYRTLRARSKTMRPGKAPARENSNFEYFVKQAEEAEARKASNNNNNANNNNANNNSNNNKSEEPSVNMAKSKSMPRVESKWGIFDPPAKKGTMRRLDGASLVSGGGGGAGGANNVNNAIIERHLAEDDDTLKVFMQAWNMLDTFEEHLAVQVELAQEEEKQLAKEKSPVDPSTLLVDTSFESINISTPTKSNESTVLSDLQLLLSPDFKLPDSGSPLKSSIEVTPAPKAVPIKTEPAVSPSEPAKASQPTSKTSEPAKTSQPTSKPAEPAKPNLPTAKPAEPAKSDQSTTKPSEPAKPNQPATKPEPAQPTSKPAEPATTKPSEPVKPAQPTSKPAEPATTKPSEPAQPTPKPAEPAVVIPPEPSTDPHQSIATLPKPVQEVITAITTTTVPEPEVKPIPVEPSPTKDGAVTPRDNVPTTYRGPHYANPIPSDFVESLLQYCASEGPSAHVPRVYVERIISDALAIFKNEPAIVDISLAEKDTKVVVIGDIHGQFPDLITILRDTGLPREGGKLTLVFNGDFVDRGPAGVEVLLCLYSMKLFAPKNVYLHRGNHELESINRKYNFAEQIITKYDEALFLHIQDSFAQLPLGCVIAKKVLVIHGGLPEDAISLNQIRLLPKLREDPTKATGGQEKIVQAILWSDPRERRGARPSKRGAGVEFGPDITAAFLARSDLDLLVRSHEMVEEGYQLMHNGGIMTVFSASYYCGVSTNKGAFAIFTHGGDMKRPSIVQYYAQAYSARDNVLKSCVIETLEKLREMIFVNRHRLSLDFSKRDPEATGKVTKPNWCEAMSSVMGLHIGWHGMLPYLAKLDGDKINYSKFLDRYKITKLDDEDEDDEDEEKRDKEEERTKEWQKETMGQMCIEMHSTIAAKLVDCFVDLDNDSDGKLSYSEFMNIFTVLKMDAPPPNGDDNHYYDLMRRMDKDEDGQVSQKDFEEALSPFMDRVHSLHKEDWIPLALEDLRAAIQKNFDFISNPKMRMKSAFRKCKAEGGKVQRRGFVDWIERALEIEKFTSVQKLRLATYVDFNGNGKISWKEFKKVFKKPDYYNSIQKNLFKPAA